MHVSRNHSLQNLTVVNEYEMEVFDDNMMEVGKEDVKYVGELMELYFDSFLDLSSSTTIKMKWSIKKHQEIVMLYSGVIHNFISFGFTENSLETRGELQSRCIVGDMGSSLRLGNLQKCSFWGCKIWSFLLISPYWSWEMQMCFEGFND